MKNSTIHELYPLTLSPTSIAPIEDQVQPGVYITGQINLYNAINTTMFNVLTSGYIREIKSVRFLTPNGSSAHWNAASTFFVEKSSTIATHEYLNANFLPLTGGNVGNTITFNIVKARAFVIEDNGVGVTGSDQWNEMLTRVQEITGIKVLQVDSSRKFSIADSGKVFHFNTPFFGELSAIMSEDLPNGFNIALMNTGPGILRIVADQLISTGSAIETQYSGAYVYKDYDMNYAVGNLS